MLKWLLPLFLIVAAADRATAAGYDDFVKGQKALVDLDFPHAVDLFGSALADSGLAASYRVIAYTGRADAYRYSGKCDLGLADADKALALAPGDPAATISRAEIQICLGQYDLALESYSAAMAITPLSALYRERSKLLLALGRGPEALADAEQAVQGPLDCRAWVPHSVT